MRGIVLKPFPWLPDGINAEYLVMDDERDFGRHFGGLRASGFIAEVKAIPGAPETQTFHGTPENKGGYEGEGANAAPLAGSDAPPAGEPPPPIGNGGEGPPAQEGSSPRPGTAGDTGEGAPGAVGGGGANAGTAALSIRHVGRGKWAVYRGEVRLTEDALTKEEAASKLAEMQG